MRALLFVLLIVSSFAATGGITWGVRDIIPVCKYEDGRKIRLVIYQGNADYLIKDEDIGNDFTCAVGATTHVFKWYVILPSIPLTQMEIEK